MTTVSYRPRTGEILAEVNDTPSGVVRESLRRAASAATQLAATSPAQRRDWLDRIATSVESASEELTTLADDETGLGPDRLRGEIARAAGQLRFYGEVAAEGSYLGITRDRATSTTPTLVRANRPIGPVAVFGASNFPFGFGVLGNDTASALAAGCPVVAKAHPAHPQLSSRLGELATASLTAAGAPANSFALVSGYDSGLELVTSDSTAAVAFTGSQAGGMAIYRAAQARSIPIPVFAEMGTVNPVVVTRDAAAQDLPGVARGFATSFTLGSGQFCTKPGLLFAPAGSDAANVVSAALAELNLRPVMLTEAIARATRVGIDELVAAGAVAVARSSASKPGWSGEAAVLSAPISAIRSGSRLLEECFGPVALVVEYNSTDELVQAVSQLQGALAASVITHGNDDSAAPGLIRQLSRSVGRIVVDGWPTGVAYNWAQHHGGPWPATTMPWATSVGAAALSRFVQPVAYQSVPDQWLPMECRESNPWALPSRIDGKLHQWQT